MLSADEVNRRFPGYHLPADMQVGDMPSISSMCHVRLQLPLPCSQGLVLGIERSSTDASQSISCPPPGIRSSAAPFTSTCT